MLNLVVVRRTVLMVALLLAGGVHAEIPVRADAYTAKDYHADLLEHHQRTMVEAYQANGSRDSAWDDRLLDYLQDRAVDLANEEVDAKYRHPVEPWPRQREHRRELAALGCDEPLFLVDWAALLQVDGKREEARQAAQRAYEGMVARGYAPMRISRAAWWLADLTPKGPERDAAWDAFYAARADAILSRNLTPFDRRFALSEADPDRYWSRSQRYQRLAQAATDPDPWGYHMLMGLYHLDAGWEERGSGWASTVTEEGWDGFAQQLAEARKHLTRAWEIHPQFPEAATAMIKVAMAGHAGPGETTRLWFDRAVAGHFDHEPAYNALEWALRPRWGGSHEQMLAFGFECVATGRFDTEVPIELLEIVRDIVEEEDGRWYFVRDPSLWPQIEPLFQGLLAEPLRQPYTAYWKSYYAGYALRFEQHALARSLIEEVGEQVRKDALERADVSLDRVRDWSSARTGAAAAEVASADHAMDLGQMEQAKASWERIAARADADDLTRRYARHRIQQLRWQDRLMAGDPVRLIPDADLHHADDPEAVVGLNVARGTWEVVDQTLIATSDGKGVEARLANPIGSRWRLSATLDFGFNDKPSKLAAGLLDRWNGVTRATRTLVRPGTGFQHTSDSAPRNWRDRPVDEIVQVTFERWDDQRRIFIDGQLVHDCTTSDDPFRSIGLASGDLPRDAVIVYHEPTVQVLTAPPAWLNDPGATADDDDDDE